MTTGFRTLLAAGVLVLGGLAAANGQRAGQKEVRKVHRAVIEVTTEGSPQWEAVLNNVENLQKAFAPEQTEVGVVAHGKALAMLQKTNAAQAERMSRIAATGVKFAACENTMRRHESAEGRFVRLRRHSGLRRSRGGPEAGGGLGISEGRGLMMPNSLLLGVGVLAALTTAMPAQDRMHLTILHTNDIHGHIDSWCGWEGDLAGRTLGGFDRLATAVEQVRSESQHVLLLDAGDAIGDTLVAASTKGKALIDLMNEVRYDAMTLGNHEPDFGMDVLRQRINEARFDVLAANVVESGSKQLFTKPYVLRSVDGVKVAILGIAYPNTPLTTAKKNVAGYEFRRARETAAEYVPKVRAEGAELVIVLSHLGLSADQKLAEAVPDIDVIVGGHSHNRMKQLRRTGQTVIVQSGAHLSDLGRLDLEIENGKVAAARSTLITLDHAAIASNRAIARKMEHYRTGAGEAEVAIADAPIVRAQTLAGSEPSKRHEESPADSMFADIVREHARAEIAFLPGVGYGVAIPAGLIRKSDLKNLVPHESKLVAMTLTGTDIKDILEQSVENVLTQDPQKKVGGMVQVSGLTFTYQPEQKYGSRVETVLVGGKPLDQRQQYRTVTNSMLADGGHNYRALTRGSDRRELEPQYDIIESALRKRGRITTPERGRIREPRDD